MARTRGLEYIAVRLDAVHGFARHPDVRKRIAEAKARLCDETSASPSREDIIAALDPGGFRWSG